MAGSRTYRTKVLVLDKTKLKETDLILTMLDERGRQVRAVAKGARKPGGRLAARCELFCTVDMLLAHGRSLDVVSQAELVEAPLGAAPDYETTCAASAIAEVARVCSFEDAEDPFTFAITQRALTLVAAGSTRHIWTCSWRPLSLNCCRTLVTDPISRLASRAAIPCSRISRPKLAGFCAGRAPRACLVPSWYRPVRSHGCAPSCP